MAAVVHAAVDAGQERAAIEAFHAARLDGLYEEMACGSIKMLVDESGKARRELAADRALLKAVEDHCEGLYVGSIEQAVLADSADAGIIAPSRVSPDEPVQ